MRDDGFGFLVAGIVGLLFTVATLCWAMAAGRPHAARCPDGWWLPEGVRSDGSFICKPNAPIHDGTTPRGGYIDLSTEPPGWLRGRVYCPGRAATDDGVSVVCKD